MSDAPATEFAAESAIIARLKTALGAAATVTSFAAIFGAAALSQYLPLIAVAPLKSEPFSDRLPHYAVMDEETWQVSVFAAQRTDVPAFAADFSAAGLLIAQVRAALQGWRPGAGYKPMRWAGLDQVSGTPGEIEFQLRFSVAHAVLGVAAT